MKIIITGGTGFLGSYLLRELLSRKLNVVLLKRSTSNVKRIADCMDRLVIYDVDVIPLNQVIIENKDADYIIHTATNYGRNGDSTGQMLLDNVKFPLTLMEEVIKYIPGCTFLNIDSILDRRINSYAMTKKQFVEWGRFYTKHNTEFTFINVLLEHIYGPFDDKRKFISWVIDSCMKNIKEMDLTKGEQERDFIFVTDVVDAIVCIVGEYHSRGYHEYEVGSGRNVKIKDAVEYIKMITKSRIDINWGALPYRKYEIMKSSPHIEKISSLGWQPKVTFKEGINKIIEREYYEIVD